MSDMTQLRRPPATPTLSFKPRMEALEDRLTPAPSPIVPVDIISASPTLDGTFRGANAPVDILDVSSDGRTVLVQSKATNLVPGQIDIPDTTDLFYVQDGNVSLVSAQNGKSTISAGVAASTPGVELKAVLAQDGSSVVYLSGTNAGRIDPTFSSLEDAGGDDLFFWTPEAGSKLLTIAIDGTAAGSDGIITSPSLVRDDRPDGTPGPTLVYFRTTVPANFLTRGIATGVNKGYVQLRDGFDLFRIDVEDNKVAPISYTVVNVGPGKEDFAIGMEGDVTVDPLGRYANGAAVTIMRSGEDDFFFGGPFGPTLTDDNSKDIWTYNLSQVATQLVATNPLRVFNIPRQVTNLGPQFDFQTFTFGPATGTVGNVVVADDRSDRFIFSAKINPGADPTALVPGYINQNGGDFDFFRFNTEIANPAFEVFSQDANNPLAGANAPLDLRPNAYGVAGKGTAGVFTTAATNLVSGLNDRNGGSDVFVRTFESPVTKAASVLSTNSNVTGNGPSFTPSISFDGGAVAYATLATNISLLPDNNNASDIFTRSLGNGTTTLNSTIPGFEGTGNAASATPFIAGNTNAGRVFFTSIATDLNPNVAFPEDVPQVFASKFPIILSKLSRDFSYTGGNNGLVALAEIGNDGRPRNISTFQPFPGFKGEIRVATGDFNGDGVNDVVVGAGPGGGPRVAIIDGFTGRTLNDFFAYEPSFTGGVYVGAGDVNGDGVDEILLGAGEGGGPRFQVYDSTGTFLLFDEFAFEQSARSGVRVAAGDYNFDTVDDIFVSAGIGGGPRVRIFDGRNLTPGANSILDMFVFERGQRGGAYIEAGDYNGDGFADLIVGAGPDGGPRVTVFDAIQLQFPNPAVSNTLVNFFAFDQNLRDGVRVALRNIDGDNQGDIIAGTGDNFPRIRTYLGALSGGPEAAFLSGQFVPFDSTFGTFGAWVG